MPQGVNEKIWAKAKAAAAKQGHDEDWPYVMGIYKRMNGESSEEKTSGKIPGVPDGTGPRGRGAGPGKGKADGSGLITGMSKEDFIARFMKDVPEDQRNKFLAKYFPNNPGVKKKASALAGAILKNARYGTGTINNPTDNLATDQNPDMATANRLDNIATRDAGSVAKVPGAPDGTGPYGRGAGPGKGKADGSGLIAEMPKKGKKK
jgi:hypothetical protein